MQLRPPALIERMKSSTFGVWMLVNSDMSPTLQSALVPAALRFLVSYGADVVEPLWSIERYLDFVLVVFLAFGFSFEVPVAVVILVVLGVVTPAQLREARGYVIVGIFILAAIVTPPDVVSQLLLAIPMCLLYELGIIAGGLLKRPPARA